MVQLTAGGLRAALEAEVSETDYEKNRSRITDESVPVIGVRMGTIFALAKKQVAMPLSEVDLLLSDAAYESRMAAVSILDAKARSTKLSDAERGELYNLWMRRIDRINTGTSSIVQRPECWECTS